MAEEPRQAREAPEETPVGRAVLALYRRYEELSKKEEHIKALQDLVEENRVAFGLKPEVEWLAGEGKAVVYQGDLEDLMLVNALQNKLDEIKNWLGVSLEVRAECPADLPEPPKELPKFENKRLAQLAERLHKLGFTVRRTTIGWDEYLQAYYALCGLGNAIIYLYAYARTGADC